MAGRLARAKCQLSIAEHFLAPTAAFSIIDGKLASNSYRQVLKENLKFEDGKDWLLVKWKTGKAAFYLQFSSKLKFCLYLHLWIVKQAYFNDILCKTRKCNHCANAHLYNISSATMKKQRNLKTIRQLRTICWLLLQNPLMYHPAPLLLRPTCPIHLLMKLTLFRGLL